MRTREISDWLKSKTRTERLLLACFFVAIGFFVVYMRTPLPLNFVLACVLVYFCVRYNALASLSFERLNNSRREWLLAFVSLGFATSMILGYHIVYEEPQHTYYRLAIECYFSPWSAFDALALLACTFAVYCILHATRNFLLEHYAKSDAQDSAGELLLPPKHAFALGAVLLFICWIPWLITWWPGFLFTDAVNEMSFNTFVTLPGGFLYLDAGILHPFILGAAQQLALAVGDGDLAFAFASLFQMFVMSIVLSHFALWLSRHASPKWKFPLWALLLALYAFDPYHAAYSISHWKDPLFAMAMIELVLALADLLFASEGAKLAGSYVRLFVATTFAVLMRNNGQAVLAVSGLIMLISALVLKRRQHLDFSKIARRAGTILVLVSLANYLLMTQVLPVFGGWWSPRERMGLRIAQVARVAAIDGNLSEEDKAFLNSLMPLEDYQWIYCPQWVDPIKFTINSNPGTPEILENDFTEHWISIGLKNPKAYVGAWVLQTTGFWSVNIYKGNAYVYNFEGGVLHFEYDYSFLPLKNNPELLALMQKIFPTQSRAFPAGWALWLTLGAMALLISLKRSREAMILLPGAIVLVGCALFSVVDVWPRYALAGQFLLILVPLLLLNKDVAGGLALSPQTGSDSQVRARHARQ